MMRPSVHSKPSGILAVSRSQVPGKRSVRAVKALAFTPDLQPAPLIPGPGPHIYSSSRRRNAASKLEPNFRSFDYVVIGSGIAGLTYALKVAEYGSVAVITKEDIEDGCTQYAQGGVCAVLDPLDSVKSHADDTMVAGGFLNNRKAVDVVCREGAQRVLELADLGAQFTHGPEGKLHLAREGGHSARRIVHAADTTGAEITRALVAAARAHGNITIFEHHACVDLVTAGTGTAATCLGVDVMDGMRGEMVRFVAPCTMLASGGAGQLYPTTTNPDVVTGDGIAMAWRANAAVANMEFVQFHPTALAAGRARGRCFLVSEAVRGEGGILTNADGYRFMPQYDARLELAPRDVVARAIQDQMLSRGEPHVLLDVSHKPAAETLAHFPAIAAHCRGLGIDITQAPIPVAPAQHYLCGGVSAGLHGETSLPGLFACGEVACSGLHGANRLASNSLLEGLVFGGRAVTASLQHAQRAPRRRLADAKAQAVFAQERAVREPSRELSAWIGDTLGTLRDTMWATAGITRTDKGLSRGFARLSALDGEVAALVATYGVSRELSELRSLVTCGQLVLRSAMLRRESRGLHFNADVPEVQEDCAEATQLQLRPDVAEPVPRRSSARSTVSVRHSKSAEVGAVR